MERGKMNEKIGCCIDAALCCRRAKTEAGEIGRVWRESAYKIRMQRIAAAYESATAEHRQRTATMARSLTDDEILEMHRLDCLGVRVAILARRYGRSVPEVERLLSGEERGDLRARRDALVEDRTWAQPGDVPAGRMTAREYGASKARRLAIRGAR